MAFLSKANPVAETSKNVTERSQSEKVLKHNKIGFCNKNNIDGYEIDESIVLNLLDSECKENNKRLMSYYTKNEIYQNGFEFYDNCVDSLSVGNTKVQTGKIDYNYSFTCTSNLRDSVIEKLSDVKNLVQTHEKKNSKIHNQQQDNLSKEFELVDQKTLQSSEKLTQKVIEKNVEKEFKNDKPINEKRKGLEQFQSCSVENLKILAGKKFKQYEAIPDLIPKTLDICNKAKNENLVLTGFGNSGSWEDNSVSISFSNLDSVKKKGTHAVVQGGQQTEYFKKQDLGGGWSNDGIRFTKKFYCDDFTKPSILTDAISTKGLFDKSNRIVYDEEFLFASNRYAKKVGTTAKRILDSNLFCRIANGVDPNTVMKDYYFDLGKLKQDKLDVDYDFIKEQQKEIYCGTNPDQRHFKEKEGYPKFTCEKEFEYYIKKGLERAKEYERERIEQGIEQNAEIKRVQEEVRRYQEDARNLNTKKQDQHNIQKTVDNRSFSSANNSNLNTNNNFNSNKKYNSYTEQIEKTNTSAKDYSNKLFNSFGDPRMQQAILFLNQAQFHFLSALEEKEAALATKIYAENLKRGSAIGKDELQKILVQTQEHQKIINKKMQEGIILTEKSKNEFSKGFSPYAEGVKILIQQGFDAYSLVDFITSDSGNIFGRLLSGVSLFLKIKDSFTAVPLFFSSTGDIFEFASLNEIRDIEELSAAKDSLGV